jgi:hypothetical protein
VIWSSSAKHNHTITISITSVRSWVQEQTTCLLCKSDIPNTRYDLTEDGKHGKIYKLAGRSSSDKSHESQEKARASRLLETFWTPDTHAAPVRRQDYSLTTLRLQHKVYSLHMGSNRRQPADSRYSEVSPQRFMTDPERVSRARIWLYRELRVFEFSILTAISHKTTTRPQTRHRMAEFLLKYIITSLKP